MRTIMKIEKEELIIKKYYREIYHTKVRVQERLPKLNRDEILNLELSNNPRNKAEEEIKKIHNYLVSNYGIRKISWLE